MLVREQSYPVITVFLILSLLILSSLAFLSSPARAAAPAEITTHTIFPTPPIDTDEEGNEMYLLTAGLTYEIEFALDIAKGVEGNIVLDTQMEKSKANFWELLSPEYKGVTSAWQPGKNQISFDAVEGTPTFKLSGYVSEDVTTSIMQNPISGTVTLHQPGTLSLMSLSLSSGEVLAMIPAKAVDKSIVLFNEKKDAKRQALNENSDLAEQIDGLAEDGYTEQAIAILNTLPSSGWDSGETSSTIYFIIIAVFAVLAVLAFIMLLRGRGTVGFLRQRVTDQADKLDIVESRLHKLGERSLINDVVQIRDSLREMGRR